MEEGNHSVEATNFADLSDDLAACIISKAKLSVQELCRGACLSRKMKAACYTSLLWHTITLDANEGGNVYGMGLEAISGRCKELEELTVSNIDIKERPNPWMHYGLEQLLLQCGDRLTKVRLQFACVVPFTDLLLKTVGKRCPHLADFELSAKDYYATDVAVSAFIRDCPEVRRFRCFVREAQPLHALGDLVCWTIAKKWPALLTLEVNGHHISENGVLGLEDCRQLEHLGLHGYKRGTFDRSKKDEDGHFVTFDSMRTVTFAHVLPSPGELRRVFHMCPNLSRLELKPKEADEHVNNHAHLLASVAKAEASVEVAIELIPSPAAPAARATQPPRPREPGASPTKSSLLSPRGFAWLPPEPPEEKSAGVLQPFADLIGASPAFGSSADGKDDEGSNSSGGFPGKDVREQH